MKYWVDKMYRLPTCRWAQLSLNLRETITFFCYNLIIKMTIILTFPIIVRLLLGIRWPRRTVWDLHSLIYDGGNKSSFRIFLFEKECRRSTMSESIIIFMIKHWKPVYKIGFPVHNILTVKKLSQQSTTRDNVWSATSGEIGAKTNNYQY
jgi:hypothetical protein